MKEQEIKHLTDIEHVLLRPQMYIGSNTVSKNKDYIIKDGKFIETDIQYVPGLFKLFNELIDNSVDEFVRTKGKFANKIDILVDNETFTIQDNGRGIPINEVNTHKGTYWSPELAWTELRAGSNFEDDKATTIGTNGVGSSLCSIFSTKFVGTSNDGKLRCTVTCKDNNSSVNTKVIESTSKTGVKVVVTPDVKRFGLEEITLEHIDMINQRLHNLSVSYPDITFKLNGIKIKINSKKFLSMFSDNGTIIEEDKFSIGIFASDSDDFKQFSLMNGLTLKEGGVHIDYITNTIVKTLRDKISKKYKSIKPNDVKRKLFVVAILKDFNGPKYETQTKEKLTNNNKDIINYFSELDLNKLAERVYKNKVILDSIIDYFKIAEAYKEQQLLEKTEKKTTKKPKDDKFLSPVGEWDNVLLCEGDSAQNGISSILGRDGMGYYAMFGVPPNAYDMSMKDILSSVKMKALQKIIGLKFSQTEQNNINFKNIILATDADLPGFFIRGQLLGLFFRFGRNLFIENRIKILITPLFICTKKEKIIDWFYSFEDQKKHENSNKGKGYSYEYKKGLSSWDKKELQTVIDKDTLENMLEVVTIEDMENASKSVDNWLNTDSADIRKEMLEGYLFNIHNM